MLRRFATLLCFAFLFALFLPLAVPRTQPDRVTPAPTESAIRLAPIVVSELLVSRLDAQSTAVVADSSSRGTPVAQSAHKSHWLAIVVAPVIVLAAAGAWFISKRSFNSSDSNYQSPGDKGRARPT
jgi:hypothetical protein